jgi:hypothetical protein
MKQPYRIQGDPDDIKKAEEAERLANQKRREAEQRERYKGACEGAIKLAVELERKVDEAKG